VPTEISLSAKRFQHKPLDNFPIRGEIDEICAQLFKNFLRIFVSFGPQEAMVKADNQWFQLELLNNEKQLKSAIFPPRERNDAVVIGLAPKRLYDFVELGAPVDPVNFLLLEHR
jgi:hypothetical protein